jgi:hypothetical protein
VSGPRDPHVLANGSIGGAGYVQAFGTVAASPDAQVGEQEVISFLRFNLDGLNTEILSITVSGFSPGPGAEATPNLDALAFFTVKADRPGVSDLRGPSLRMPG